MPTKDGFDPDFTLPRFLAAQAEQEPGDAPVSAAPSSRGFKATILIATAATAIGIAIVAVGNPMTLLAEAPASLTGNSSPQSAPTIQDAARAPALALASADAEALPPITTDDAPTHGEAAVSEPAAKDQVENSGAASETLYRQFQAWAAEQDTKAPGPVQSTQDAPAAVAQDTPALAAEDVRVPHRLVQKRRHVRAVRNARAEMRTQNHRRQIRRVPSERAEGPPVADARVQGQSAPYAQAPSFLPTFGFGN